MSRAIRLNTARFSSLFGDIYLKLVSLVSSAQSIQWASLPNRAAFAFEGTRSIALALVAKFAVLSLLFQVNLFRPPYVVLLISAVLLIFVFSYLGSKNRLYIVTDGAFCVFKCKRVGDDLLLTKNISFFPFQDLDQIQVMTIGFQLLKIEFSSKSMPLSVGGSNMIGLKIPVASLSSHAGPLFKEGVLNGSLLQGFSPTLKTCGALGFLFSTPSLGQYPSFCVKLGSEH